MVRDSMKKHLLRNVYKKSILVGCIFVLTVVKGSAREANLSIIFRLSIVRCMCVLAVIRDSIVAHFSSPTDIFVRDIKGC